MAEYVLWGFNHRIGHPFQVPLKLTGGTLAHCRAERSSYPKGRGWQCAIYRKGAEPTGLRLQALDGRLAEALGEHARDRSPLCPVVTRQGYEPALPKRAR